MTPKNNVIDAEIVAVNGVAGAAPELVAADEAMLAMGAAVANARASLSRAHLHLIELEIVLAEINKRVTGCPCGCGIG